MYLDTQINRKPHDEIFYLSVGRHESKTLSAITKSLPHLT